MGLHLIRGLTGFAGGLVFCLALKYISLTVGTLLFFSIPLFMPFVGFIWKKKPLPRLGWIGLIIGFIGVGLVIQPGYQAFQPAALLALLSGLLSTISQFSAYLLTATDKALKMNFYYFLLSAILGGLLTLYKPVSNWGNLTFHDIVFFCLIGILGICYLQFIVYALKHGPPNLITSLLYTVVIISAILDWVIWKHIINWETLLGVFLVVLGAILKLIFHHIDLKRLKNRL